MMCMQSRWNRKQSGLVWTLWRAGIFSCVVQAGVTPNKPPFRMLSSRGKKPFVHGEAAVFFAIPVLRSETLLKCQCEFSTPHSNRLQLKSQSETRRHRTGWKQQLSGVIPSFVPGEFASAQPPLGGELGIASLNLGCHLSELDLAIWAPGDAAF